MIWLVNLAVLAGLFLFSYKTHKSYKTYRIIAAAVVLTEAVLLLYLTRQQFLLWSAHEISRFLLPPHRSLNYFIFYSFTRIWLPYLVSGVIGSAVFWIVVYLNKKYGGRFFQPEEPYFLFLVLFLAGHPGWLLYVIVVLAAALLMVAYKTYKSHQSDKVVLYYLWLPAGAAAIILNQFLLNFYWYSDWLL